MWPTNILLLLFLFILISKTLNYKYYDQIIAKLSYSLESQLKEHIHFLVGRGIIISITFSLRRVLIVVRRLVTVRRVVWQIVVVDILTIDLHWLKGRINSWISTLTWSYKMQRSVDVWCVTIELPSPHVSRVSCSLRKSWLCVYEPTGSDWAVAVASLWMTSVNSLDHNASKHLFLILDVWGHVINFVDLTIIVFNVIYSLELIIQEHISTCRVVTLDHVIVAN